MITKAQAESANNGDEFHYTGRHACTRTVGPRGGVKECITRVRVTGQCQTWKRSPERFRLPVKYGMYESSAIHEWNAANWHRPSECPLNEKEGK